MLPFCVKGNTGLSLFRLKLKYPFAPFMHRLDCAIAPKHLLENVDLQNAPFNKHPIGSGPFKLVDWDENDTLVLDANREYFRKDRPILDRLIFKSYSSRQAALQAIGQDEMDIALNLTASDLLFVSKRGSFRIYPASGSSYYAMVFNLKDPLFRDIRVRKALDYSIDKPAIIDNQLRGYGSVSTGPFDIGSWAYNPNVKATPFDLARARKLLSQAGWQDVDGDGILEKNGEKLEISIAIPNISDILERIALAIKAQLMKVGVKTKLVSIDGSKLYETEFQALVTIIGSGADPDYVRRVWHSQSGATNLASYSNSFVDDLLETGMRVSSPELRKNIYHKIHEMIHDDCPAVFLASALDYIGSAYRFRASHFSSMIHFLTTMKDWQIVTRKSSDTTQKSSDDLEAVAKIAS